METFDWKSFHLRQNFSDIFTTSSQFELLNESIDERMRDER